MEINRLYVIVGTSGNDTLLYVGYANDSHPAGIVEANANLDVCTRVSPNRLVTDSCDFCRGLTGG